MKYIGSYQYFILEECQKLLGSTTVETKKLLLNKKDSFSSFSPLGY